MCVVHLYCSVQLSMFNMEKRYRNKIIIIIIIFQTGLTVTTNPICDETKKVNNL